jgi:superfamily II DNA/RNA helicase
MTFQDFALDQRILAGVRQAGYQTPTPIQAQAIPAVLAGRDVLGLAQTGTGKTAAFALPILQHLLASGGKPGGPVRALVLSPTRELAQQTHETFRDLGRKTGHKSIPVFGGVGQNPQVAGLRRSSIAVACPGRLLDLLNQGLADLSRVDVLVLDEADRMLDMGFLPDIRRILKRLGNRKQTLLFSATMPHEIRALTRELMHDPEEVRVSRLNPVESVDHALYPVAPHQKPYLLEALLRGHDHQGVLVFTRTKHKAKALARKLSAQGFTATSLQGNLSQNRRREAMDGFKKGAYQVMVATDIAARGIDCEHISHVINFDMPDTADTYTHRIGRTGRAGRTGQAWTLVTREDAGQVRAIERVLGERLDRLELEGFDYSAPARSAGPGNAPAPDRDRSRKQARPARAKGQGGRGPSRKGAPKPGHGITRGSAS